jgi:hypothetical protein
MAAVRGTKYRPLRDAVLATLKAGGAVKVPINGSKASNWHARLSGVVPADKSARLRVRSVRGETFLWLEKRETA